MDAADVNRLDFEDHDPQEESDGHQPHPDRPTQRLQGNSDGDQPVQS